MEHRINYGRLYPGQTYKADCTCGWTSAGPRERVYAAVREHEQPLVSQCSGMSNACEQDEGA